MKRRAASLRQQTTCFLSNLIAILRQDPGTLLTGVSNAGIKNHNFQPIYIALSRKGYNIEPKLLRDASRILYAAVLIVVE